MSERQPNPAGAAGDDDLAQMTPNQRRALNKALAALETMAALWASEIRLTDLSKRIADVPDAAERAKRIAAFVEQGFIEGAYRHYLDHKDQIEALATVAPAVDAQPVAEVGPRLYDGLANPIRWTDMKAMDRLPIGTKLCPCTAKTDLMQSGAPVYQARARGTEQAWVDVNHNGFLAALAMRSMEARILYNAPKLPEQSLETLRDVIRCLRETGVYRDEEGESTNALQDLVSGYSAAAIRALSQHKKGEP